MAASQKKHKSIEKTKIANITFESILASECQIWWENAKETHVLKEALRKVEGDKIIFMAIIYLKEFESVLRIMIVGHDKKGHNSVN